MNTAHNGSCGNPKVKDTLYEPKVRKGKNATWPQAGTEASGKERGERRRQRSCACVWAWTWATAPGCACGSQKGYFRHCNVCFELVWQVSREYRATGLHKTLREVLPRHFHPIFPSHARFRLYFTRGHGLTARLPQVTQKVLSTLACTPVSCTDSSYLPRHSPHADAPAPCVPPCPSCLPTGARVNKKNTYSCGT